jgi:hypothetical protein
MTDITNWYAFAGLQLANADTDWTANDIRCALLKSTYVPSLDAHDTFSDVSAHEVTGTLYTAGGVALAGKASTVDSPTKETRLTASPVQWGPGASIADIKYAVLYDNTPGPKPLLGLVTLELAITVTAGVFRITWAATGALRLKAA